MKKYILIVLLFFSMVVIEGCTDLEEEVLDESLTGGATEDQITDGALAPVYAVLPNLYLHTNYFALQEISTTLAVRDWRVI